MNSFEDNPCAPLTDMESDYDTQLDYIETDTSTKNIKKVKSTNKDGQKSNSISGARVYELSQRDIDSRCHRCMISDVVARHVNFIKMYYCSRCKMKICEHCYIGSGSKRRTDRHDKHKDKVRELNA